MPAKKKQQEKTAEILAIRQERIECYAVGTTPLVLNSMSAKAKQQLLYPRTKNKAARAATLKHDPIEEFRESVYRAEEGSDTVLSFPATAFKSAMSTAALEIPGATKTSILRLCYVPTEFVPLYGVPELFIRVVRQAGINKTPDVRTRAIIRRWVVPLDVRYIVPNLSQPSVVNLLAAAGVMVGVGDFRVEKGKGSYGQFEVADARDARVKALLKSGAATAQAKALEAPVAYDRESEDLWQWFEAQVEADGRERAA